VKTISGVDVEIVIASIISPCFSANVLDEARASRTWIGEIARRRDFRDLPIITIDGETAKIR